MRHSIPMVLLFVLFLSSACEKDIDVAEWKEISVIYAVVNIKDSVQYLRINRMYTAPHDAPYQYTSVNDSVNYPQDLFEAFLEEYQDGELVGEPNNYYPVDRQKEPGMFSSESNCVYKTSTLINPESEYKIRVINKETGKEVSAQIEILGNVDIEESFSWERAFFRVNYPVERLQYEGSLDPYDHDDYIVRFLYWETKDGVTDYKYVDWLPTYDPLKNHNLEDTNFQLFDDYWEYLSEQIEIDPSVKRVARGVDYMLALPGKEIQNYITVTSTPTNPHFYPNYSNIFGGEGVFGSKYYYTYFGMELKRRTVDTISWGRHLINHRFADSSGEWH